jgi:general secretion pathway protein D
MTAGARRGTALLLLVCFGLSACASATPSSGTPPVPAPTRVEVHTEEAPPPPRPAVEAPPAAAPPPPRVEAPPPPPPPPAAPPAATPKPPPRGRQIVLNFDNADIEVVLQATAEIARFNYVLAPNVRGRKVTLQTVGKIGTDEVFPLLLTILDVNGLAAVKTGSVYRIIPREGAPQAPLRTIVGREPAAGPAGDEIVTQIVPLQFLDAAEAMSLLRPFVPQESALGVHPNTNLLIVTDTATNVRRLLDILKSVDVANAQEEPQIIPLKNADAQELAPVLQQLFTTGRFRPGGVPGGLAVMPPPPGPTGGPPRPPVGLEPGLPGERVPLIVADRRSNSLLVNARKPELETIRRLVDKLDVNVHGGQRVFVYFAENTKARDLVATLDAIYGRGETARAERVSTTGGPGARPVVPASRSRESRRGPRSAWSPTRSPTRWWSRRSRGSGPRSRRRSGSSTRCRARS